MPKRRSGPSGSWPGDPNLELARSICRMLAQALHRSLKERDATEDEPVDLKTQNNLLQSYQKALQTLVAIESDIEKRRNEERGRGSDELDLDAARQEILGRIARLRASGEV